MTKKKYTANPRVCLWRTCFRRGNSIPLLVNRIEGRRSAIVVLKVGNRFVEGVMFLWLHFIRVMTRSVHAASKTKLRNNPKRLWRRQYTTCSQSSLVFVGSLYLIVFTVFCFEAAVDQRRQINIQIMGIERITDKKHIVWLIYMVITMWITADKNVLLDQLVSKCPIN